MREVEKIIDSALVNSVTAAKLRNNRLIKCSLYISGNQWAQNHFRIMAQKQHYTILRTT